MLPNCLYCLYFHQVAYLSIGAGGSPPPPPPPTPPVNKSRILLCPRNVAIAPTPAAAPAATIVTLCLLQFHGLEIYQDQ